MDIPHIAQHLEAVRGMAEAHAGQAVAGTAVTLLVAKAAHWWVWPKLRKFVPAFLAAQLGRLIVWAVQAHGWEDADVRQWVKSMVLATVVLAESKFPDAGLGPQRYAYAFTMLSKTFPWLAPFLATQGDDLQGLIEEAVLAMDARLKASILSAAAAPPQLPPPAGPTTVAAPTDTPPV